MQHYTQIIIIIIVVLLYFTLIHYKYKYKYKYPELQIIKNPIIFHYYQTLEKYSPIGVSIPVGMIKSKVLLLLNIATTKNLGNKDIYDFEPKTCTLELIQESIGGTDIMKHCIQNGILSMMDTFPIRISNNDHKNDLPQQLINYCIDFTAKKMLPILQNKIIFSFGDGGKYLLKYMQTHPFHFDVTSQYMESYGITVHHIDFLEENFSCLFVTSIHPSSIYYDISIDQAQQLDNVFSFMRGNFLLETVNTRVFSYQKFIKHKNKDNYRRNSGDNLITRCLGKNNYIKL